MTSTTSHFTCQVCGHQEANVHTATEMMFGLGGTFHYLECASCGLLQLENVPADMGQFYPQHYYSMRPSSSLKDYVRRKRGAHHFVRPNLIGSLATRLFGPPVFKRWFERCAINSQSRILDVGCGSGSSLKEIAGCGFAKVAGIDPYLSADVHYLDLTVRRAKIEEIDESFDLVMLNHSFEHMPDPHTRMRELAGLLHPRGTLLIRIPTVGYAWRCYGTNWVGIDAPRHFYLYTVDAFRILCEKNGLEISHIEFDSSAFQFWASEQNQRQIHLESPRSYLHNPKQSIFTKEDIQRFTRRAEELNAAADGDSASFYLRLSS